MDTLFTDCRRLVYLKWHKNFLICGRGMLQGWEREMHTGFCQENVKKEAHLNDLVVDGAAILKWLFKK
jgi:hypothetical protein